MENSIYKKYQMKYKLPDLKDLTNHFAIKIDSDETILLDVLDSMIAKISTVSEGFEGIMTGDGFSSMFEAGMLNFQDKEEVFRIYRNLKSLTWDGRMAMTQSDEKEMARAIKKIHEEWSKLSARIVPICKKLSEGWKDLDVSKIVDTLYHG